MDTIRREKIDSQFPTALLMHASIKVLRETQIPKRSATLRISNGNEQRIGLRTARAVNPSQDFPNKNLAKFNEELPLLTPEIMGSPLLPPATIEQKTHSSCFNSRKDRVTAMNTYTTFPEYQRTAKSERNIIKKYAKKMKVCLLNVGSKILGGLEAIGHFYASSEQKWQCEYATTERLPSQPSVWEAIDTADKARNFEKLRKSQRKSRWIKYKQYRWKAFSSHHATLSTNALPVSNDSEIPQEPEVSSAIPPIPEQLLAQAARRPQHIQSSYKSCRPILRGSAHRQQNAIQPRVSSHIPAPRPRCFSPPQGRMHHLERQSRTRSNDALRYEHKKFSTEDSSNILQKQKTTPERRKPSKLSAEKEKFQQNQGKNEHGRNEDIATPWSGLETLDEEQVFFGAAAAMEGERQENNMWKRPRSRTDPDRGTQRMHDDEAICEGNVEAHAEANIEKHPSKHRRDERTETIAGKIVEREQERDCDGFEASGDFCLRHESCAREAMALGRA